MPGLFKTIVLNLCIAAIAGCVNGPAALPVNYVPAAAIGANDPAHAVHGHMASGQPNSAALAALATAGYAGVIDLRTAGEQREFNEAEIAESLGLRYEPLPIAGAGDISYENAAKLDDLLMSFDGPVLLHCGSGNRVGALIALRARAAGATEQDALAAGRAAGLTRLEYTVRERLKELD